MYIVYECLMIFFFPRDYLVFKKLLLVYFQGRKWFDMDTPVGPFGTKVSLDLTFDGSRSYCNTGNDDYFFMQFVRHMLYLEMCLSKAQIRFYML